MQIVISCITGLLCLLFKCTPAQIPILNPIPTVKQLAIGDKVPDIILSNLYNYSSPATSFSTFRGKLVLIDFWATYCASCVHKMDLLENMQNRYPDQLKVLLVSSAGNADTRQRIDALFGRIKNDAGERYHLPVVLKDTVLSTFFPHKNLPHLAWINETGKVIAITGPEEITDQNIRSVIEGNIPAFAIKEDQFDFNPLKGLFRDGNGGNGNNFLFRSIITPNINGIPSSSSMDKDSAGMVTRISHANLPLLLLLQIAYEIFLPNNRIDLRGAGMDLDYTSKGEKWQVINSYCYDMVTPPVTTDRAKRYMQQDLERYFGLTARIEKKRVPCYLLTVDSTALNKFRIKGGKAKNTLWDKDDKELTNHPLSSLNDWLDYILPIPVVNESGYPFNIDIQLPGTRLGNDSINKALLGYGIKLIPANRMLDIFTINHQHLN